MINLRAFTWHARGDVARPRDVTAATHCSLAVSDDVRVGIVRGIALDDLLRENRDGGQGVKMQTIELYELNERRYSKRLKRRARDPRGINFCKKRNDSSTLVRASGDAPCRGVVPRFFVFISFAVRRVPGNDRLPIPMNRRRGKLGERNYLAIISTLPRELQYTLRLSTMRAMRR